MRGLILLYGWAKYPILTIYWQTSEWPQKLSSLLFPAFCHFPLPAAGMPPKLLVRKYHAERQKKAPLPYTFITWEKKTPTKPLLAWVRLSLRNYYNGNKLLKAANLLICHFLLCSLVLDSFTHLLENPSNSPDLYGRAELEKVMVQHVSSAGHHRQMGSCI